jgi:FemAB-related protein (PEP-CTERM system-associated)
VPEPDTLTRKTILADPLAQFASQHPDATSQQLAAISSLAERYIKLDTEHDEIKLLTQQLSRQIGQAKKDGGEVDELLAAMKKHSKHLKVLETGIGELQEEILVCFNTTQDAVTVAPQADTVSTRIYSATNIDANDIHVSLDAATPEEWNRYVESNPAASLYHRAEWQALIKETFGHSGYYFSARDKTGNITGVLPLIRLRSRLFGDFMVSMPYFNYGGAVADHPLIEQHLMEAAAQQGARIGVSHIEFRDDTPRRELPARTEKVNMILRLPDNQDELWQSFTPKLRAQIRRPQRENPQVLMGGVEYLDDFYAVFSRNMRDLGTPVYSRTFFRNILDSFPDTSQLIVVRLADRPVAAAFLIGHRDTLEIPWASTLSDVNRLSINMLLYWETLKYAIKQGYRNFDFGRSSKDSGTYRFKQQWGAQPRPLYWHYWQASGDTLPSLNPDNPRYALAIKVWQRLPLTVTTALGPLIVKNLP